MLSKSTTRPYRMGRRAEAIAATRKAILDVTIKSGDPRTSLAEVARLAGVSERTVLRYFGSRDGLVTAVIREVLADEGADPQIDEFLADGRAMQRRWIDEKLGPLLSDCDTATRRRRRAQLVAVCGVYVWKLLRKDGGLGRSETERAIRELIEGVIDPKGRPSS
jgi:AcrR family transcriptional regulator